ncbi:MAG TPA: hypothetical protein VEK33_22785 [Terriglobales bacterium]|nr:hypothetical protein [Terriglobales bacterium]
MEDPDGDTQDGIRFIRELKRLPEAEIIGEHYTPARTRTQMYGGAAGGLNFRPPLTHGVANDGSAWLRRKT